MLFVKTKFVISLIFCGFISISLFAQRQMENLDRGIIAMQSSPQSVYIGWRILATDDDNIEFSYRSSVAWQNTSYNQPPHTGFYLGAETKEFPKPNILIIKK